MENRLINVLSSVFRPQHGRPPSLRSGHAAPGFAFATVSAPLSLNINRYPQALRLLRTLHIVAAYRGQMTEDGGQKLLDVGKAAGLDEKSTDN
ncbi:hypothetical protein BES34_000830 [Leptospira inadai serovar Lyme]|uniref:Uncharacterized protein n=1 Tax=Leptospira inadai serovar Lyme TaxID=293084 RepID=A0ABX4YNY2_9LEPT|nr:hypothetical protein BES34_000830 [Leptospira inadai serovar Lyme]